MKRFSILLFAVYLSLNGLLQALTAADIPMIGNNTGRVSANANTESPGQQLKGTKNKNVIYVPCGAVNLKSGKVSSIAALRTSAVTPCEKPVIRASGPLRFCTGGSITLSPPVFNTDTLVSTYGGNAQGYADGSAALAQFSTPAGVACDGAGNVFVSDMGSHTIRKITPTGIVSTIAGSGATGFADGTGAAARFASPSNLVIDANGILYVADYLNNRIRKVLQDGTVTTIAGSTAGYTDGPVASAKFSGPRGICRDAAGNIYVAELTGSRIRKISTDGIVSTVAGKTGSGFRDGNADSAQFLSPTDVKADAAGNLIVCDMSNNRIRKITPAGIVSTIAGSGATGHAEGPALTASFARPYNLFINQDGNYVFTDIDNACLRILGINGMVSTIAGGSAIGYVNGKGRVARFDHPYSLTSDNNGNYYVGDIYNFKVRKVVLRQGPEGYLWSDGSRAKTVSTSHSGIFSLRLVIAGCTTAESDPVNVIVSQDSTPVITAGGPTSFCSGDSLKLTSSVAIGNLWSNGDTAQEIYVHTLGRYFVRTRDASCTSAISNYVVANVYLRPPATTISLNGNTLVAENATGQAYQWYKNNTLLSGQNESTMNSQGPGSYTVTYFDARFCVSLPSPPYIVTGVEKINNTAISIVSNPVQQVFRVTGLKPGTDLSIINMHGQNIYKTDNYNGYDINLQHLPAGIYQVRAGQNLLRLIKE